MNGYIFFYILNKIYHLANCAFTGSLSAYKYLKFFIQINLCLFYRSKILYDNFIFHNQKSLLHRFYSSYQDFLYIHSRKHWLSVLIAYARNYSVRRAVTGSLFAAFLDGSSPPSSVSITLRIISMIAGITGRTALTSFVPAK